MQEEELVRIPVVEDRSVLEESSCDRSLQGGNSLHDGINMVNDGHGEEGVHLLSNMGLLLVQVHQFEEIINFLRQIVYVISVLRCLVTGLDEMTSVVN
ncbi:hypothetical protein V6N11_036562 [Hibiscus sabdariffa]|uniref:Uncharacterized protein n=1 Tax=Hibiscus sabdariffa TaxID=183260 RepID=A0ABR2RAS2_9ROSI